jgi:hypothetical protein
VHTLWWEIKMAIIGSNTLEIRRVMQREVSNGNVNYYENLQYRTKDIIIAVLGISLGTWSDWQSLQRTDLIYVDENGNPL